MSTSKLPLHTLEQAIGYSFQDQSLLISALTHASFANEAHAKGGRAVCNERLEFLGDSVLSLAAGSYLYRTYPELPEGQLSRLRAAIVCKSSLSDYASMFSLGEYLYLGHGLELSGGRTQVKILEDAFEALLGAIYLDGGLPAALAFAEPFLAKKTAEIRASGTSEDYKTMLQEFVQRRPDDLLEYVLISESGPDNQKQFTIEARINGQAYGTGTASSKRAAEQHAARDALVWFQQTT